MTLIQCLTDGYTGFDEGAQRLVKVGGMGIVSVSEQKAEQLLTDFPGDWKEMGDGPDLVAPEAAPNVARFANETKPARPRRTKAK